MERAHELLYEGSKEKEAEKMPLGERGRKLSRAGADGACGEKKETCLVAGTWDEVRERWIPPRVHPCQLKGIQKRAGLRTAQVACGPLSAGQPPATRRPGSFLQT